MRGSCGRVTMETMKHRTVLSSCDWIAYFYENTQMAARRAVPEAAAELPEDIRRAVAASLPAWQLGKTSEGRYLRAAARQYADEHDDQAFLSAVDFFIREGRRHGAALGEWLEQARIPRKRRDVGESLFRFCRSAVPSYAVWASVVVMVESMEEIYFAAVMKLVPCPRLKAECEQVLHDAGRHVQFQCEHLAAVKHGLSRPVRALITGAEAVFLAGVALAIWIAHGKLMRMAGVSFRNFVRMAAGKRRVVWRLSDPERYDFPRQRSRVMFYPVRARD